MQAHSGVYECTRATWAYVNATEIRYGWNCWRVITAKCSSLNQIHCKWHAFKDCRPLNISVV